jgi:hypothetical protein
VRFKSTLESLHSFTRVCCTFESTADIPTAECGGDSWPKNPFLPEATFTRGNLWLQIFGQKAFGFHGKYFRLLHFTSEQSYGPKDQRAVLRFSFKLPPLDQMKHLTKLISSVGVFVDVVGNYKLSPDQRKRAEKVGYCNLEGMFLGVVVDSSHALGDSQTLSDLRLGDLHTSASASKDCQCTKSIRFLSFCPQKFRNVNPLTRALNSGVESLPDIHPSTFRCSNSAKVQHEDRSARQ